MYWTYSGHDAYSNCGFDTLMVKLLVHEPTKEVLHAYYPPAEPLAPVRPLSAPVRLREPMPVLPWIFGHDIDTVLDASNKPLVAYKYAWEETLQLSDPDPPDVPTCAHIQKIMHAGVVPYATSLPLLCSFAAPPQPRFLSGSFNASPMDDTDEIRAFYRGMAPSPLMLRRPPRPSIELMVE
jgi:hypothetical protein